MEARNGSGLPRKRLPKTAVEKVLDLVSLLIFAVGLIYLISVWNSLPERVPIHFNARGEADGWGSRNFIWFLPSLSLLLWIGLTFLERVPHLFNFPVQITEENAERQYKNARMMSVLLKTEIIAFLTYTCWKTIEDAKVAESVSGWIGFPLFLAFLLLTVAFFLIRSFRISK